jgi:hypothetical protein
MKEHKKYNTSPIWYMLVCLQIPILFSKAIVNDVDLCCRGECSKEMISKKLSGHPKI